MKNDIREHLSVLLNTKNNRDIGEKIKPSLLNYGIPDLSHLNPRANNDAQLILDTLTQCIDCFEPRLQHVRTEIVEQQTERLNQLVVRIEGVLAAKPQNDEDNFVTFTTVFNPQTPHFIFK